MQWFRRDRIPLGNWPFLVTTFASLRAMEEDLLTASIDLTEGQGAVTISGCLNAYRQIVLRRVLDLAQSVVATWNGKQCIGAIVCARSLLETLAVFYSLLKQAEAAAIDEDWEKIGQLVDAYAFSTMKGPKKKQRSPEQPPRIKELVIQFIRATNPGKEQFWEQICDIAHPNGQPMFSHFGLLRERRLDARPQNESEPGLFVAIYNCIYSICWFSAAMLDYDILLEWVRCGKPLPNDHPLIKKRNLVDSVVAEVIPTIGKMHIGPRQKRKKQ